MRPAPAPSTCLIGCWQDEVHVRKNRDMYREKSDRVLEILQPVMHVSQSDASFYLWPETPINDEEFALRLFQQEHVTVLPVLTCPER